MQQSDCWSVHWKLFGMSSNTQVMFKLAGRILSLYYSSGRMLPNYCNSSGKSRLFYHWKLKKVSTNNQKQQHGCPNWKYLCFAKAWQIPSKYSNGKPVVFDLGALEESVLRWFRWWPISGNGCRNRKYLYLWHYERHRWNSNDKSGIYDHSEFSKSVGKWLQQQPTARNSDVATKPDILISLELWQIALKFQWQIPNFRLWQAPQQCSQVIATAIDKS